MEKEKFELLLSFLKKSFSEITSELVSTEYEYIQNLESDNKHKVVIIIGMTGLKKGRVLLSCDYNDAEKFATEMNFGDPLEEKNDLYMYMAEFANMFCGRLTTYMNDAYNERLLWLTPPAILSGKNLDVTTPNINTEKLYFTGSLGNFMIDVGFAEGN